MDGRWDHYSSPRTPHTYACWPWLFLFLLRPRVSCMHAAGALVARKQARRADDDECSRTCKAAFSHGRDCQPLAVGWTRKWPAEMAPLPASRRRKCHCHCHPGAARPPRHRPWRTGQPIPRAPLFLLFPSHRTAPPRPAAIPFNFTLNAFPVPTPPTGRRREGSAPLPLTCPSYPRLLPLPVVGLGANEPGINLLWRGRNL